MQYPSDLPPFRHDPIAFLLKRGGSAKQPFLRLSLGRKRIWMATDASFVKPILKASEDSVDDGYFMNAATRESSPTTRREQHRRRREALNAIFAGGNGYALVPQTCAIIREACAALAQEGIFVAHEITAPLMLRMICLATFGKGVLSSGDENAVVNALKLVEHHLADEDFAISPWSLRAAAESERRRLEARRIMDLVVCRVRPRAPAASAIATLARLGFSQNDICDELITMLLAGHQTIGSTAAWVLYYLATLPRIAQRIAVEADSISIHGELLADALHRAECSRALVQEVLRLFPPVLWLSRNMNEDWTTSGVKLRKGDTIIISPWHLHRDPRWWDAPDDFNIDRNYVNDAYIPFVAGPRNYFGTEFATLQLQLLALEFAATFSFSIVGAIPRAVPLVSGILMMPCMIPLQINVQTTRLRCELDDVKSSNQQYRHLETEGR